MRLRGKDGEVLNSLVQVMTALKGMEPDDRLEICQHAVRLLAKQEAAEQITFNASEMDDLTSLEGRLKELGA